MTTIPFPVKADGDVLTAQNLYNFQALMCKLRIFNSIDRLTDGHTVTDDNQQFIFTPSSLYTYLDTANTTAPFMRNNNSAKRLVNDTCFVYFGNVIDDLQDGTVDTNIWSFTRTSGTGSETETTVDDSYVIQATWNVSANNQYFYIDMDGSSAIDAKALGEDVCVVMPVALHDTNTNDLHGQFSPYVYDGSTYVTGASIDIDSTGDGEARHFLMMWYYDHSAQTVSFFYKDAEEPFTTGWNSLTSQSTSALTAVTFGLRYRTLASSTVNAVVDIGVPVYVKETTVSFSQDVVLQGDTPDVSVSSMYNYNNPQDRNNNAIPITSRAWTADGTNFNTITDNSTLSVTTNTGTTVKVKITCTDLVTNTTDELYIPTLGWNGYIIG